MTDRRSASPIEFRLIRPDEIRLTASARALLQDAHAEREKLQALGAFTGAIRDEIHRSFLPARISDTLTIEGIRVNPRVTEAVLEGHALAESDRYGEREILNVSSANDLMEDLARSGAELNGDDVHRLHRRIMDGLLQVAGQPRTKDVEITGARLTPPPWRDVPKHISNVIGELGAFLEEFPDENPVIAACWLHRSIAGVHPFSDGNGRLSRLLQDYVLVRHGYLPVGIPQGRSGEYYDALEEADGGEWGALISLVAHAEVGALERAGQIAEAPLRRRNRVRDFLRKAETAAGRQDDREYQLWIRKVDVIRAEFETWCRDLNAGGSTLRVVIRTWDPVSFERWAEVREVGWAPGTWTFSVNFYVRGRESYSALFFARRHDRGRAELMAQGPAGGSVGLFVTGAHERTEKFDFSNFDDPHIRLREIAFGPSGDLWSFHEPRSTGPTPGGWVATHDAKVDEVVGEFIAEMLPKVGLVS